MDKLRTETNGTNKKGKRIKSKEELWRNEERKEFQLIMKAAEGSAEAQFKLGVTLAVGGCIIDWNAKAAVECISQAASNGLVEAQHILGVIYWKGWGVRRDAREAKAWFHKAWKQGSMASRSCLKRIEGDWQ